MGIPDAQTISFTAQLFVQPDFLGYGISRAPYRVGPDEKRVNRSIQSVRTSICIDHWRGMGVICQSERILVMTVSNSEAPDLSREEKAQLARDEKNIARKYIGLFPTLMVTWWIFNSLLWISMWPLVLLDIIPLWLGFIIGLITVTLSYLPSHEAQHGNITKAGAQWHWLNELIGHTATIPLAIGYRILRLTHMEHHAHTNDPELDPDINNVRKNFADFLISQFSYQQPGRKDSYAACLQRLPDQKEASKAMIAHVMVRMLYLGWMIGLAWSGFAIEALVLWWLPKQIGLAYIRLFLSWLPHHPGKGRGRYRDTRAWKCLTGGQLGNFVALGMEYHIVLHLHPNIPLNYTPQAYWEMRDILVKRGCQIEGL